jgi:hypothetical protein
MLPPELIRPEMIVLKRKKKKNNPDDFSDYEEVPEEEDKNVPTVQQMRCEDYWRAMQAEAEVENKLRAKIMNNYKWDLEKFEFFELQVPTSFVYLEKTPDDDVKTLAEIFDTIIVWMKTGWHPEHIKANTLKNYYAFGFEGFFK